MALLLNLYVILILRVLHIAGESSGWEVLSSTCSYSFLR